MVNKLELNSRLPTKPKRTRAKVWWIIHQWVGLKLSIFISFIMLTGTLAVFSNEIDWMTKAGMRVDPATLSEEVNWPAIADTAYRMDDLAEVQSLNAPLGSRFAASAVVITDEGERRLLYMHPSTGELQGDYSWVTVQRVLRFMHRHLFLPTSIGVPIVSSLSLLLAVSLATSLVVYKKWWRGFLKPIRFRRNARAVWGDAHRLAGVWSLWFTVLMVLTGLWYLVESLGLRAPAHPSAQISAAEWNNEDISGALAMALRSMRAAQPQLEIRRIVMPSERSGAFVFQGDYEAILVRPRSNAVWVDASDTRVQLVTDGRDLSVHQRVSEMADPLHFGSFGGLWTKTIWFVFGAALTFLSISGVAIYTSRILKKEKQTANLGPVIRQSWRGMGVWAWPSTGLSLLGLTLWVFVF
ncbi:MAG: PepSY-associated TM helix domain-containing protein [Pseudomonadota bacterium]